MQYVLDHKTIRSYEWIKENLIPWMTFRHMMNNSRFSILKIWSVYQLFALKVMKDASNVKKESMATLQNKLFANGVFYAMPFIVIALIPTVIIEFRSGQTFIAFFNIISLISAIFILFNKAISLLSRKIIIGFMIITYAVILMVLTGSFMVGFIYLFALNIFISIQFSSRAAYAAIGTNLLICIGCGLALFSKPLQIPIFYQPTVSTWLIYCANFLIINLVLVTAIRDLLNGLEKTMLKESYLFKELYMEMIKRHKSSKLLAESSIQYKTLFFQSPLPKIIFDAEILQILQINEAAIQQYNFTEDEFLNLNLADIFYPQSLSNFQSWLATQAHEHLPKNYVGKHVRNGGELIHVEIRSSEISFEGKAAKLIIATDISKQINDSYILQQKNEKLRQIAYLQSHVIRAPLANIMGLSELILQEARTHDERELLGYLNDSVIELDAVIRNIVSHTDDDLNMPEH